LPLLVNQKFHGFSSRQKIESLTSELENMHEKYENLKDKMIGHGSNDTIQFEGHEKFETKKVLVHLSKLTNIIIPSKQLDSYLD
jgi:hypothetical protein